MNIFMADLDWGTLLIIGIGLLKVLKDLWSKKKETPAVEKPVYAETWEEEEEETEEIVEKPTIVYYKKEEAEEMSEIPVPQVVEEPEEEGEKIHFDIRQAVISSEILKRPEF